MLIEKKKSCLEVDIHSKESITLALYNYFFICRCNDLASKIWKMFVEDEFLVTLSKILYYLTASRLNIYKVYIQHKIKLASKLQ